MKITHKKSKKPQNSGPGIYVSKGSGNYYMVEFISYTSWHYRVVRFGSTQWVSYKTLPDFLERIVGTITITQE